MLQNLSALFVLCIFAICGYGMYVRDKRARRAVKLEGQRLGIDVVQLSRQPRILIRRFPAMFITFPPITQLLCYELFDATGKHGEALVHVVLFKVKSIQIAI